MKKIIITLMVLFMLPMVMALDWCALEVPVNTECSEVTPILGTCGSYTVKVYNSSYDLVNTYTMTQISTSGSYYFNFTGSTKGVHKWVACDNSSGTINVGQTDKQNTTANADRIITEGNSLWTTATGFATVDNVSTIITNTDTEAELIKINNTLEADRIITHGDINWTTASSITSSVNTTAIANAVWETNVTKYSDSTTWKDVAGNLLYWIYSFI